MVGVYQPLQSAIEKMVVCELLQSMLKVTPGFWVWPNSCEGLEMYFQARMLNDLQSGIPTHTLASPSSW